MKPMGENQVWMRDFKSLQLDLLAHQRPGRLTEAARRARELMRKHTGELAFAACIAGIVGVSQVAVPTEEISSNIRAAQALHGAQNEVVLRQQFLDAVDAEADIAPQAPKNKGKSGPGGLTW